MEEGGVMTMGPIMMGEIQITAIGGDVLLSINETDGTLGGCVLTMTAAKARVIAAQLMSAAKEASGNDG